MSILRYALIVLLPLSSAFAQQTQMPLWKYNISGPSNSLNTYGQTVNYTGTMVGQSPFDPVPGTTNIPVALVPLKLVFPPVPAKPWSFPLPGVTFDPTTTSCVAGRTPVDLAASSPLFNNLDYTINGVYVGRTQYVDAFQRANFWSKVANTNYHLLFALRVVPTVTVNIPSNQGSAYRAGCFGGSSTSGGSVNQDWLDAYIQSTLLPLLTRQGVIGPGMLPIFYLDTVGLRITSGVNTGLTSYSFHSSVVTPAGRQFYLVVTFNASGATPPIYGTPAPDTPLSDELVTWVSNPFSTNQSPAWGWVGNNLACRNLYAPTWPLQLWRTVGVPLNGFMYTETEQTFFSWFYDQAPSMAAGGVYSDHGSITALSHVCPFAN